MQVTNITSHTLGVVLWDEAHLEEYVFPMINKMSAIPAMAKNFFGTASANMPRAVVRIVEGESTLPAECTPLGICDVELPPFLPKGSPGRAGLRIQREPGSGGGGQCGRQPDQDVDRTKYRPRAA